MKRYRPEIRVIPNGLDISRYTARPPVAARPRLVWVRAFHSIYNPELAVSVASLLSEEFPEIELLMVGPDKGDGSAQRTAERIRQLGMGDRVCILGPVAKDSIPHVLTQGDVFLNTTDFDNTPVTVVEAMASGMCIVSTDVGGLPFLLEHEVDALLVPRADPRAMADAVRRILLDTALARRISSNACRKAEACDWTVVMPRWEGLLAAAADSRR